MEKHFFSVRAIAARNYEQAVEKCIDGIFDESHPLSDKILTENELRSFQLNTIIPAFHVFTVKYLPATNSQPSRLRLRSDRFQQGVTINPDDYRDERDSSSVTAAVNYLKAKGFNITGFGEGKNCMYVFTDTFEPIRKK